MKSKSKENKPKKTDYHSRQLRRNQIIFGVVAIILILSWILSLIVKV